MSLPVTHLFGLFFRATALHAVIFHIKLQLSMAKFWQKNLELYKENYANNMNGRVNRKDRQIRLCFSGTLSKYWGTFHIVSLPDSTFFCNNSWCHLIVSNQDSTIAFCFAENEHRICVNRTMMMMMMMSDVVLVNTPVLTIYFEHADAACTDLSTFPATRHDRHFWPTFSDQHFWPTFLTDILTNIFDRLYLTNIFCSIFLLLSSAEPSSVENKLRGRRGILSGRKSPFQCRTFKDNLFSQSYLKKKSDTQENWFLVNKLIFRWRGYIPHPLKRRKIQMLGFTFPLRNIFCKIHYEQSASSVKYKQTQRWLSHLQAGLEKLLSELVSSSGLQRVWKVGRFSIHLTILFL